VRRGIRLTAAGLGSILVTALGAGVAVAASPTPTPAAVGDPRSSGQGPGLVGDPLFAIVAVVVIAGTAVLLTLAWIRFTSPPTAG
jgi:hypothetical protein